MGRPFPAHREYAKSSKTGYDTYTRLTHAFYGDDLVAGWRTMPGFRGRSAT